MSGFLKAEGEAARASEQSRSAPTRADSWLMGPWLAGKCGGHDGSGFMDQHPHSAHTHIHTSSTSSSRIAKVTCWRGGFIKVHKEGSERASLFPHHSRDEHASAAHEQVHVRAHHNVANVSIRAGQRHQQAAERAVDGSARGVERGRGKVRLQTSDRPR